MRRVQVHAVLDLLAAAFSMVVGLAGFTGCLIHLARLEPAAALWPALLWLGSGVCLFVVWMRWMSREAAGPPTASRTGD